MPSAHRRGRFVRTALLLSATVLALAPARAEVPGAPPNDAFAAAIEAPAIPFTGTADHTLATPEPGEPPCGIALKSAWYRYTPSVATAARATAVQGEASAASLSVHTGTSLESLTTIRTCGTSTAFLTLQPGTTYYFRVAVAPHIAGPASLLLTAETAISGKVTGPNGEPAPGVCIEAFGDDFWSWGSGETAADGTYLIRGLTPDDYYLWFLPCAGQPWLEEFYDDAYHFAEADTVSVAEGVTVTGIDAQLSVASLISGTITKAGGGPASNACLEAFDAVSGAWAGYTYASTNGTYVMGVGGSSGTYKVRFGCEYGPYVLEWYDDKPDRASADVVTVPLGGETSGIDAVIALRPPPANDHFANAAAVSALPYGDTVDFTAATAEAGEPAPCGQSLTKTAWYAFTPATSGVVVASANDTATFGVYAGPALAELDTIACNKTNRRGSQQIGFPVQAGTTYYVQIGMTFSATRTLSIDWASEVTELALNAPAPCGTVCPYWDQQKSEAQKYEATCDPNPASPAGSWAEHTVTVPEAVAIPGTQATGAPTHLVFLLGPDVDHDAFVCRATPDGDGNRFIATGANSPTDRCPEAPVACREQVTIPVTPGETLVLRVYNWSDVNPDPRASFGYKVSRS